MNSIDDNELLEHLLTDAAALDAYNEARYRRRIAHHVAEAMQRRGFSYRDLAEVMGTSKSQVQRLLNKLRGGGLTLLTLVKAGRALDMTLEEVVRPVTRVSLPSKAEEIIYFLRRSDIWARVDPANTGGMRAPSNSAGCGGAEIQAA